MSTCHALSNLTDAMTFVQDHTTIERLAKNIISRLEE